MVKVNADGDIVNYAEIAGVPFPNPKSGLEIAWNYDFNTHGDANHYARKGPVVSPGVAMSGPRIRTSGSCTGFTAPMLSRFPHMRKTKKAFTAACFCTCMIPRKARTHVFLTCAILIKAKRMTDICGMRPSAESGA